MRGKPWSHEEEGELMRLVKAGGDLGLIAGKLGKSVESVKQKMRRLGLVVGTRPPVVPTTTSPKIVLPEELPTVEETLRKLAGALDMAVRGGLTKAEVNRLQVVANIASKYKEILADYLDYRGLEIELERHEKELAELKRKMFSEKNDG